MRVLILGGTGEASELAGYLAGDPRFDVTYSLAGRTGAPLQQPGTMRVGGFGGIEGLRAWLARAHIQAVVDATHPFAAQMSQHAVTACVREGIPLASIHRAPWQPRPGDHWTRVASVAAAVDVLGPDPRRVFLSLGRMELGAFVRAPWHRYLARLISEPAPGTVLPPGLELLFARGPFDFAAERELLMEREVDCLVSKNSGGSATRPKIDAARELGLEVVMIDRPVKPAGHRVESASAARDWLESRLAHAGEPGESAGATGSERGV